MWSDIVIRKALSLFAVVVVFAGTAMAQNQPPTDDTEVPRAHHRPQTVHKSYEVRTPQPIGVLLSVGDMLLWQKTNDGRGYNMIQRYSFRAGYSFRALFDVYGEYGFYHSNSDSGGNVAIHLHHDEYLVWVRKMFLEDKWWGPYAAAGLGAQQELVKTTLDFTSTRNTGDLQLLGALAGGVRFGTWVQVMIEGRLSFSAGYNPNPEPGIGVQLGTRF